MNNVSRPAEAGERNLALRIFGGIFKTIGTLLLIGLLTGMMLAAIFAIYARNYLNTDLDVDISDFTLDQTTFIYTYDKELGDYVETT